MQGKYTVIIVHAYNFTHLHESIKPQHVIHPAAVDLNIISSHAGFQVCEYLYKWLGRTAKAYFFV